MKHKIGNKRPLQCMLMGEKERDILIDLIIDKVKEKVVLSDEVRSYKSVYGYTYHYRTMTMQCVDKIVRHEFSCDEDGKFSYFKDINEMYYSFFTYTLLTYLRNKIRMHGSIEHIKFLEGIIGKERTLSLLKIFAEKNRMVAMILERYINDEGQESHE